MATKKRINHIPYADIARILAAFSVVLLHTAGARLIAVPIDSREFLWAAFFDCITRWSVPLFIMLSGMLFLNKHKKLDVKVLYKKNIFHMVTAFVFWSYVYNFYTAFAETRSVKNALLLALKRFPNGAMHLWFIFVIIGLYIILPFARRMCENMTKKEAGWFIVLSAFVSFLPKSLSSFEFFTPFTSYIAKFEINFALGYIGLFVAGWYIACFEHSRKFKNVCYILGVAGFLYMFIATVYFSRLRGVIADEFMSFKSLSSFLMAFAVFMAVKDVFEKKPFKRRTVSSLVFYSKYTFGIYLIHEMFLNISAPKGWVVLPQMPYIGIPVEAVIIFVLSGAVVGIINALPFGKYIT